MAAVTAAGWQGVGVLRNASCIIAPPHGPAIPGLGRGMTGTRAETDSLGEVFRHGTRFGLCAVGDQNGELVSAHPGLVQILARRYREGMSGAGLAG